MHHTAPSTADAGDFGRDVRAAVVARIEAETAVDERERQSLNAFVEAFDQLAEPFSENAAPTHVTASAIVVGERGVVLHRHKRLGLWLQPGGHIEPGESPWAAARREAEEETGLTIGDAAWGDPPSGDPRALVHVDVHPGPRGHTHLDLRYLVGATGEPRPPEGESQDVRWFAWDEAIAIADAGLRGALLVIRPR